MVEIFGKSYYIDVDRITDKCRIENTNNDVKSNDENGDMEIEFVEDESQTINIFKYELIKMCIERILSDDTEVDENMGVYASNTMSISFRLAFNTLIKNEILIENEDE